MDRWDVNIQIWWQKYSNVLAIISLFLYSGHVHFLQHFGGPPTYIDYGSSFVNKNAEEYIVIYFG